MKERISYQELDSGLLAGVNKTEVYLHSSGFDKKLLELVKYRVSQINGCAFCLDMHHQEAVNLGESELRLHSVVAWRDCPFYSDQEKTTLNFAEVLTNANHQDVEDDLYAQLTQFYSKKEIAVLTVAITNINTWNRINKVFKTIPGNYKIGQFG
ncbi:carboxymuconolactone decarboxylase family protein [Reichenbachiella sp. MALMAid0571]|uniref:carboxymuconolactone decarboxylase family protein n=1 Tax=Reichenbachiella sp. MALMAid0571 TaxID=3143939 RepID=UPI0032DF77F0